MEGLDKKVINKIDHTLAIKRILIDVSSDFIISPQYKYIYKNCSDELWDYLKTSLNSGKFSPELPIYINVPKPSGLIRIGAILKPLDRLIYQAIADLLAPSIEKDINRRSVYSNILLKHDSDGYMFENSSNCYKNFKEAVINKCKDGNYSHVIKTDIASYFDTIDQHRLINSLRTLNCDSGAINLLEELFLSFRERHSYGIITGLFPSDLFGNYYLNGIDNQFLIDNIESIRYVDDIYIFLKKRVEGLKVLENLCNTLRKEGLFLNESKTKISTVDEIHLEETETDRIFNEINEDFKDIDITYGIDLWDDIDSDNNKELEQNIELSKVEELYVRKDEATHQKDQIIKFCLPKLAFGGSDIALKDGFENIIDFPYLIREYCNYFAFLSKKYPEIKRNLSKVILDNKLIYSFQLMWIYYCLTFFTDIDSNVINQALKLLRDKNSSEVLRGILSIFIGKNGNSAQKKMLINEYSNESSDYVKAAIMYSSQYFPSAEAHSCRKAWGSHNFYNSLLSSLKK